MLNPYKLAFMTLMSYFKIYFYLLAQDLLRTSVLITYTRNLQIKIMTVTTELPQPPHKFSIIEIIIVSTQSLFFKL